MQVALNTRLNLPARKFFIKDLQQVTPRDNNTQITNLHVWGAWHLGLYTEFSIVWIQGKITDIITMGTDLDEFTVSDETGIVHVTKPKAVPSGCAEFRQGLYIMVVGELQSSGQRPIVRAMKIQDLTGDNVANTMWEMEVKDMYSLCCTT